jgi:hypothetical protein
MGFSKQLCSDCGKKTWHYKEGDKPSRCSCKDQPIPANGIVQGGSMYSRKELPTEREIRIANRLDRSMWQVAEQRRTSQVDITDEPWAAGLFADAVLPDPNKLYCSFCQAEITNKIDMLTEKKPVIRKVLDAFKVGDEIALRERVMSRAEEVRACPNCILQIRKPIVVRTV